MPNKVQIFEKHPIRAVWDDANGKWWFSIVDIVAVLTDSPNPRKYWSVLKTRLKQEGSEVVSHTHHLDEEGNELVSNTNQLDGDGNELTTNCSQLKMMSSDGKYYKTDVADTEQVLRIIQSVPSKKAEPFKMWLARVGNERIDEASDPELSIDRAIQSYRRLGYSENWINQRIKSIEVRKALTDEWDKSGVQKGKEYADLTDLMSKTWSGMTTREYKKFKGLKKEGLRDNMTNTELVLNMLAEVAATDISIERQPANFGESAAVAKEGAKAAKVAREQIERSTGKSSVSSLNAKTGLMIGKSKDRKRIGNA